jgi:translocation and assembly module TamA
VFTLLNSLNAQLSLEIVHSGGALTVTSARSDNSEFNYRKEFKDSLEIAEYLHELIKDLQSDAFLSASADSVVYTSGKVTAWLHMGIRYRWVITSLELVDPQVLREIRIPSGRFGDVPVSYEDFRQLQERLLDYYENSGYPFVTVSLQEPKITCDTIAGLLEVEKNQFYRIENIHVTGDTLVKQKILFRHIGIHPGDQYSEKKFKNAGYRIVNTSGLNQIRKAEMEFMSETADMYLYLSRRQASHFSGILGILPGESRQKIRFAGELDLTLVNVMRSLENISLRWQSPGNNMQQLDVKAGRPYLFGKGFGIELQLHMFRQDSTYMKVEGEAGIPFSLGDNGVIRAYLKTTGTSLITGGGQVAAFSAPAAGVKGQSYGLSWFREKIDNRINPYRGWSVEAILEAGNKTVTPPPGFFSENNPSKSGFGEGIARCAGIYRFRDRLSYCWKTNQDLKEIFRVKIHQNIFLPMSCSSLADWKV